MRTLLFFTRFALPWCVKQLKKGVSGHVRESYTLDNLDTLDTLDTLDALDTLDTLDSLDTLPLTPYP